MRKKGYSYREISELCGVSLSTVSLHCRSTPLDAYASKRLDMKVRKAREEGMFILKRRRCDQKRKIKREVQRLYERMPLSIELCAVYCSLLFWSEGGKFDNSTVTFTNSDPIMVQTFLSLLRIAFPVDERKLRVALHLHGYHDKSKLVHFWSLTCGIKEEQFIKVFVKRNTGKRIRPNYMGCVNIRCYDHIIFKALREMYQQFPTWINHLKCGKISGQRAMV